MTWTATWQALQPLICLDSGCTVPGLGPDKFQVMVNSGTYKLGPKDGHLVVKIDPEGLGKGMAHNLTLEITDWSADVTVADDIKDSTVSVTANLGSLNMIKSSGQTSDKDKADIKKNTEKTLKG